MQSPNKQLSKQSYAHRSQLNPTQPDQVKTATTGFIYRVLTDHIITALHCTALYCTALHCTALHCIVLRCTALYCTVLHCIALYRTWVDHMMISLDLHPLHPSSSWRRDEGCNCTAVQIWLLLYRCTQHDCCCTEVVSCYDCTAVQLYSM